MKSKLILFAVAIACLTLTMNATETKSEISSNTVVKQVIITKITPKDVELYMFELGYNCIEIYQMTNSDNYHVTTTLGSHFIVYVTNGIIVGHEEVDF